MSRRTALLALVAALLLSAWFFAAPPAVRASVCPELQVLNWTTDAAGGSVHFTLRWINPSPTETTEVAGGMISSQPFGVFQQNYGVIGNFLVPAIMPDSFFDIAYDVSLADLPPAPQEMLPGGGPQGSPGGLKTESNPPCPPDDHWDGNVDVTWTTATGGGHVDAHYGSLLACPGAGSSYIHVPFLGCPGANGATWQITDVCPGWSAALVNEDFTPAPANLLPTWSGWICITANAAVPIGQVCCPHVKFDCNGQPAEIELCATACDWNVTGVTPGGPPGFALHVRPNPAFGSATLHYLVPRAGQARVEIFNAAGRRIRNLLDGPVTAGEGSLTWDGRGDHGETLPAGLYLVRLSLAGEVAVRKVMFMR